MSPFQLLALVSFLDLGFVAAQNQGSSQLLSREAALKQVQKELETFGWQRSGRGELGSLAEVDVPAGYRFTGKEGTQKMLEYSGNTPTGNELGVMAPEGMGWWVMFEFSPVGYVRDTDRRNINVDLALETLRAGQKSANAARKAKGLAELTLEGWAVRPHYNDLTQGLEWAVKVQNDRGGVSVNYLAKVLGRRGVMQVTLVSSPSTLLGDLPSFHRLMEGFRFQEGEAYADYQDGDKLAKYALAGLITAGAEQVLQQSDWLIPFCITALKTLILVSICVLLLSVVLAKTLNRIGMKWST